MVDNLALRFCESRHRWLIVTGVTLVIALASVLPQVDQSIADRSERAEIQEQLDQAVETGKQLPVYERRAAEKASALAALVEREVDESRVGELRSWLVSTARQSGCQVRRIDLSAPSSRVWTLRDSPLETNSKPTQEQPATPFQLQTRSVVLSVTGSTSEVLALLKTIDNDRRLKFPHTLDLKPTSRGSHELQLDLTLRYFALVKDQPVG